MSQASDLVARRRAVVARGVGQFAGDTTVASARGARLTDVDGRELIDLAGGIGVMNVGHCNERVVAAIQEQAAKLIHTCIHVASYEPYIALCEKLVERFPHGDATKVALFNSGAEAVENAIKIARQSTGRQAVLCFTEAFHGRTMMCMSLTSKTRYKLGCGPFAPEVYRLPYPNRFRDRSDLSEEAYAARCLADLEAAFLNRVPASHIAAIIIEPVLGEGGFVPAPAAYLRGLREICDRHEIVLIFDEVQSGFARTGRWAAYEHAGVVPDISTWAKSMGGGMPISSVIGKAHIMDAALPGTIGGTYGGNPIACAASLAAIEVIEELGLNERGAQVGAVVRARFDRLKELCPLVADVRGLGAMLAVELCHDGDPERPATQAVAAVTAACRAEGVLVLPAGAHGNVIRVLSPLVITDADLDRALDVIERAVLAVAADAVVRMKPFAIAGMQLDLSAITENVTHMGRRLDVLMSVYPWVQMVVFSELAAFGPLLVNARPLPDDTEEVFRGWARKHGIWLLPGSMFERAGDKVYNTAVVIDPIGNIVGRYRKMFPFLPYEAGVEPGGEFFVFDVPDAGRFGVSICYDLWFPETARTLAAMGAEVILHPTLTGTIDRDVELAIVRATAAQNQCFVFGINGFGDCGNGRSIIAGPAGEVLYQGQSAPEMIPLEIDFDRVRRSREVGLRGLGQQLKSFRDRKVEFDVYTESARAWPYLNSLGDLQKPDRGSMAGLHSPKEIVDDV